MAIQINKKLFLEKPNIDLQGIYKIMLILTVSLIPLLVYKKVYYYTEFPKMIALFILTPLLLMLYCRSSENFEKPELLRVYIYVYIFWLIINCIFSLDSLTSFFGYYGFFDGFLFYLISIAFFFLGNQFKDNKKSILIPLVFSATIVSLLGIWGFWNGENRAISTLGHPINLANFLALTVSCVLGMLFSGVISEKLRKVLFVCLFFITIAQIMTFSRASWYGQLFIYLLFFIFQGKERIKKNKQIAVIILAIILLSIIASYLLVVFQPKHSLIASSRMNVMTQLSAPRIKVLKAAWDVFLHYPFGTGLSTFNFAATKFLPAGIDQTIWVNAHNDFFNTLVSQGLIGGIFYIVFIILLFKEWRNWQKRINRDEISAGLWAGVFGHLLMIQSSFPGYGYTYLFWLFIGMLSNLFLVKENHIIIRHLTYKNLSWMKYIWGVLLLGSIVFCYFYVKADLLFVKAQKYYFQEKYEHAAQSINKSVKLAPWVEVYKLYQIRYNLKVLKIQDLSPEKRKLYLKLLKNEVFTLNSLNPLNYRYKEVIGDTMVALGSYPTALTFYQQALELFPNNYKHFDEIGYTFIMLNKPDEAQKYFKKSLEIFPQGSYAKGCLNLILKGKK